ncbi:hypothetical protein [Mesoplasma seiffertii]|uniref:hypothetical protein n=1 Tax=Mesoplasma seiffertii TaxID=28224 RepID=UPI000478C803|nr:hypothetical protein [Mesoplasma seiffertii]
METKYVALIVCGCLYFVGLLISGLLALKYQKSHQPYRQAAQEYHNYWKTEKLNWLNLSLLTPISSKFELPAGEELYFVEENLSYVTDQKHRDLKELNKYGFGKYDQIESYYDDAEFMSFKSDYKLFGFRKKTAQAEQKIMYVTNKRIIFDQNGVYEQIVVSDIVKAYIAVIYNNGRYYPGYIIHTQKALYKVISDNPQVTLIINQIKKTLHSQGGINVDN